MEVVSTIVSVVEFIQLLSQLAQAVEIGVNRIKKEVDDLGNVVTQFIRLIDSNGDGDFDTEEVLFTLHQTIPKLDSGLCIVNNGDEVGIGQPALKLVDAVEVLSVLGESESISSDGNGFQIDFDNDGAIDDIFYPAFDFTGDGLSDFFQIVDADDNGLPDLAAGSPFYPVGSDEYNYIIETQSDTEVPALDKSFANYTVTEALLFLIFIGSAIGVICKILARRRL